MRTLYTAQQVWTPSGEPANSILIDGGIIEKVGLANEFVSTRIDVRVDVSDSFVVPGLVDGHVHLALDAGAAPVARLAEIDDSELVYGMRRAASQLVAGGVTTARDLGSPGHSISVVKDEIERGVICGPSLFVSHTPVTTAEGHLAVMGGSSLASDPRLAAEDVAARGASWLKVVVDGGWTTPGSSPFTQQFVLDQLEMFVAAAHRNGLRAAAHVHTAASIEAAVEAGFDSLEHCTWLTEDLDFYVVDATLEKIIDRDTIVCPTVGVNALTSPNWPRRALVIGQMVSRGVRTLAGTDAGIPGTPHGSYIGGLKAMRETGMDDDTILRWATADAALNLGLSDRGILAEGFRADMLIARGDGFGCLEDLERIRSVIVAGVEWRVAERGSMSRGPQC